MKSRTPTCEHCFPFPPSHLANWADDLISLLFYPVFDAAVPSFFTSPLVDKAVTNALLALGIVRKEKDFPLRDINPIAALFVTHGRKRGLEFEALRGPFGYLTFFRMRVPATKGAHSAKGAGGYVHEIDRLPGASAHSFIADDKWKVKGALAEHGYPVARGKSFWWFQKSAAARFSETLGYPIVVKPRRGSLSQHVFIAHGRAELRDALRSVAAYSPVFLVEKFVPNAELYRATVVDYNNVFVVKRVPAYVTGDGKSTLAALIRKSGLEMEKIERTLLADQRLNLHSIIPKGKKVPLHRKAILALSSKIEPVPAARTHPALLALCKDVAVRFQLPLVGIDIIMQDPSRPLTNQTAAILELNTLPNILMHTVHDVNGREENPVADALVDYVLAHY